MPARGRPPTVTTRSFVGRARERMLLRHLIADAADGTPSVVVVSGAPGAGKTALLRWTGEQLTAAGAHVLRTSGTDSALPLAAVSRLCAELPEMAGRIRSPTPEGAASAAADLDLANGSGDPGSVAASVADAVLARSRRRLVGVLIDDADALEATSRDVLLHLLSAADDAAIGDIRLLAVVTTRSSDGLGDLIARLQGARGLELRGLDEHDVFELAYRAGLSPTPNVIAELMDDTRGLPLLVDAELVRRLDESRHAGPMGEALGNPGRVRTASQALAVRLGALDPLTRHVLTTAAAMGEPWDTAELAWVEGLTAPDVDAAVADAEAVTLVQRGADGCRFTHPLIRSELLGDRTDPVRRARHRRIGDRMLARPDLDDEHLVRAALQLVKADPDVDVKTLAEVGTRAGRIASSWGAWHDASRLFGAVADAHIELGSTTEEVAAAMLEAGRVAFLDHDVAASEPRLVRARALALAIERDDLATEAALLLLRVQLAEGWSGPGHRLDTSGLEGAGNRPGVSSLLGAEADAIVAEALFLTGETDRALALVASARERLGSSGREATTQYVLARIEFSEGLHRMGQLELADAEVCFGRAAAHGAQAGAFVPEISSHARCQLIRLLRGEVGEAVADLADIERRALEARCWGEAGFAAALRAIGKTLAGDDDTQVQVERASSLLRRSGHAYTAALLGPAIAAHDARTRGVTSSSEDGAGSSVVRALAAVEANDPATATAVVYAARWRSGFVGEPTMNNLVIAVALVEVGDLLADAELVAAGRAALATAVDRGVVVAVGWPATIPRLLGIAARHAGDLGGAREHLRAALAIAEREGLRPERARTHFELARLAVADGAPTDAAVALLELAAREFDELSMHGWVGRCGATAAELGAGGVFGGGTSTERTILTTDVVGSTMTNSRLGDALYLEQLRIHDRLLRARVRQFGGNEIKHTGDGLNVAFDDPVDAVRCSVLAQADFAAWCESEPELALAIRCGVARGALLPSGGDFFGLVQAEAARLCALAAEGEVLVSSAVASDATAAGLPVEPVGSHQLRGFPEPLPVFRVS